MTTKEFNALPLGARLYIESQKVCASCGKKNDLDLHYKNYLKMKAEALYTIRGGAISFLDSKTNQANILYPLSQNDSEEQIKQKLKLALRINEVRPDRFTTISVDDIKNVLKPKK